MNYQLIYLPIIAAVVTQVIKLIIDAAKGQFSWKDLNSYGGMPSSHSATVTALAAAVGYYEGWDSAAFAISLILALIVIRDAVGFRFVLGKHAKQLNQIIHTLEAGKSYQFPHLKERLGHTPLQSLVGIAIGVMVVVVYVLIG
ncbi:divergent PAP2 family protein [Candidatus Falkowbacteria bacterium]|jgi:uncharacterized protein|nr:divergent PAP2 family protein [Candidatus Falkowbacteria bacterium]MBT7007194.1 divergent PAP2 family protein [Candidatus Falkowbacteria bacterium]